MKENPFDKVVDKTLSRMESVSDGLAKNFKGMKPFNKEPIKNRDLMNAYNSLTPQEMQQLVQTYGTDTINGFIGEMENLKMRRGENA